MPIWQRHGRLAQATEPAREVLRLTNAPQSAWIFLYIGVVLLAAGAVVGMYLWEASRVPLVGRLALAALRLGVVGLLAWVSLGPAVVGIEERERLPVIVVLRDASQSMNVADMPTAISAGDASDPTKISSSALGAAGNPPVTAPNPIVSGERTRAEAVDQLLSAPRATWLDPLRKRAKVRVLDFGETTRPVATLSVLSPKSSNQDAPSRTPPQNTRVENGDLDAGETGGIAALVAEDRSTDLHSGLTEALQASPLSGIVVFTDGQHNGALDPAEVARVAAERNVPIHVVGMGNPKRPTNLRVLQVYATNPAWQDEPFEVEAVIEGQGLPARSVNVRLIRHVAPEDGAELDEGQEVDKFDVVLPEGGGRARHVFNQTLREPGRFVYRVTAEALPGESTVDDNTRTSDVVKVLSRERIRVLLVSGAPSWDYTLIERLLLREPSVEVSCWLQTLDADRPQAGDTPIERLPRTREEMFEYDVVLLFDPNPQEFDDKWVSILKEFVGDHAGGLLYMAGPRNSGYFLFGKQTGGIRDLLPVRFDGISDADLIPTMASAGQSWPLRVIPSAIEHPLLSAEADQGDVLKRWENLPGVYWSFPASAARPAADVLLEHSDPTLAAAGAEFRPLLAVGRYGAGPVVWLGYHGSWRWRSVGRDAEFFDKFWIATCRYLTDARSLEGRRRGYLQAERPRYEIGDRVRITAELRDQAYQPLVKDQLTARLFVADESPRDITLSPLPDQPGRYEAVYLARRLGPQTVRLEMPELSGGAADGDAGADRESAGRLEANYLVELPRLEATQNWQNEPLLREIASLSGGRYLTIDQLDELPDLLAREPERFEVDSPPVPIWDRWWLMALLGTLLAVEWAGRKITRMM